MNSVGVVGVIRMRFIMPFSLSVVNDWATIIIRNIEANVNMPGAMKSSADDCFSTSPVKQFATVLGFGAPAGLDLLCRLSTCWMIGGTAWVAIIEPLSRYNGTVVLIQLLGIVWCSFKR